MVLPYFFKIMSGMSGNVVTLGTHLRNRHLPKERQLKLRKEHARPRRLSTQGLVGEADRFCKYAKHNSKSQISGLFPWAAEYRRLARGYRLRRPHVARGRSLRCQLQKYAVSDVTIKWHNATWQSSPYCKYLWFLADIYSLGLQDERCQVYIYRNPCGITVEVLFQLSLTYLTPFTAARKQRAVGVGVEKTKHFV